MCAILGAVNFPGSVPGDPTTADAVTRVDQEIHDGVDGIKIFAGSIENDSVLMMPLVRATAIVLEAHIALIPTLTLFEVEVEKAGAPAAVKKKVVGRALARLRAYATAGGDILFGTDVGYIYQFDTAEEYTLMKRAGLDFVQMLASLTTNPARRFGFSERSGRIAENMEADLTVLMGILR